MEKFLGPWVSKSSCVFLHKKKSYSSAHAQLWSSCRQPSIRPASQRRWWWGWMWLLQSSTVRGNTTWTSNPRQTHQDTSQQRSWLTSTRTLSTTTQVDCEQCCYWRAQRGKGTVTKSLPIFYSTVVSIEDPFDQDDWEAWSRLTARVGIQVVGDDLTVTNPKRIEKAAEERACNCLLLKVNQIGSVTEAIQAWVTVILSIVSVQRIRI